MKSFVLIAALLNYFVFLFGTSKENNHWATGLSAIILMLFFIALNQSDKK